MSSKIKRSLVESMVISAFAVALTVLVACSGITKQDVQTAGVVVHEIDATFCPEIEKLFANDADALKAAEVACASTDVVASTIPVVFAVRHAPPKDAGATK